MNDESQKHESPIQIEKPAVNDRGVFGEFWDFMKVRKKFWLAPIIIALLILGMIFTLAGTSGVIAPFIYAL